ncbi:MAG: hypothetical protein GC157_01610 [Frankiales bacterium]|nr:hypothetical protein [Frankiales bacterium]
MSTTHARWPALAGLLALVAASLVGFATNASAAGGGSTTGITVVAVNPGTHPEAGDVMLALTAHSERTGDVTDPSCRPQDRTIRCWGSLVLRVPELGGLRLTGLDVHRVDLGGGSCGGDDGGCGDHEALAAGLPADDAVQAQVNGIATVADPGTSGLAPGSTVQVKLALVDNGPARYVDTVDVTISRDVPGPVKPLVYASGPLIVQQVQVHEVPGPA